MQRETCSLKTQEEKTKKKALIIGNSITSNNKLRQILSQKNYQIFQSQSIQSAEKIYNREPLNLIISFFALQDGTGLTVLFDLKSHFRVVNKDTKLIIISTAQTKNLDLEKFLDKPNELIYEPIEWETFNSLFD